MDASPREAKTPITVMAQWRIGMQISKLGKEANT